MHFIIQVNYFLREFFEPFSKCSLTQLLDAEMQALVKELSGAVKISYMDAHKVVAWKVTAKMGAVIGRIETRLDCTFATVRTKGYNNICKICYQAGDLFLKMRSFCVIHLYLVECAIGNLVADIMRRSYKYVFLALFASLAISANSQALFASLSQALFASLAIVRIVKRSLLLLRLVPIVKRFLLLLRLVRIVQRSLLLLRLMRIVKRSLLLLRLVPIVTRFRHFFIFTLNIFAF